MGGNDALRARRHDRSAWSHGARREPLRAFRDPRVPLRGDHPRPERAGLRPGGEAVRGDRFRRRGRADLPPLLPRSRVQRRPARPERTPRGARGRGRPALQRGPRAARRADRLRAHVRRDRARRLHLRLVECDRGQGAHRLPPARGRRDRPRPGDPAVRGHRDRRGPRLRRHGRGWCRLDRGRHHEGVRVRRGVARRFTVARCVDRAPAGSPRARVLPPGGVRLRDRDERGGA